MNKGLMLIFVGMLLVMVGGVNAVSWNLSAYSVNYTLSEEEFYYHDLKLNTTDYEAGTYFSIGTDANDTVTWINYLGQASTFQYSPSVLGWISMLNSSSGNLSIYSAFDNRTGFFRLPLRLQKPAGGATIEYFGFIVRATNDVPTFVNLQSQSNPYNTQVNTSGSSWFNITFTGSDEELHYPLFIKNLAVFGDCSKASWTNQSNCSLGNYTFSTTGNTSLLINFTNLTRENVGKYNLSVCISDNINSTTHYPTYRVGDYNENKTSCQNFSLNVFYSLGINASNCSGMSLTEGDNLVCYVNVTTKLPTQSFSMSSNSSLLNSGFIASLLGLNWFYPIKTNTSNGYSLSIPINFTNLTKRNVGNWTVNLTLNDSEGIRVSELIYFNISRGANSAPEFEFWSSIGEDNITSINNLVNITFNITDFDFLIPDKDIFNETVNLSIRIFNRSTNSEVFGWQGVTNQTFFYTSGNVSWVSKTISFTPNISQAEDWMMNFSYKDKEGNGSTSLFNFSIINDIPPFWSNNTFYLNCLVPAMPNQQALCNYTLLNGTLVSNVPGFSLNLTNLSNGILWANDSDTPLNNLTFSIPSGQTLPPNWSMTSKGIASFNPWKQDVSQYISGGVWTFNLSVADKGVPNTNLRIVLNITNINSPPRIENLSYLSTTSEGNLTTIQFRVYDYDYLIPAASGPRTRVLSFFIQNYSSENLSVSNTSGVLAQDGENSYYPHNLSFTPTKFNLGVFTFNISVRDDKNSSNWTVFNITVLEINNAPTFVQNLANQTSAVGRQFIYKVNATDTEDLTNLTFSYSMINGTYFGRALRNNSIFNETTFNSSTGLFNMVFNRSHAGTYRINVTVRDRGLSGDSSVNLTSSQIFWLFVYDEPEILFPSNLTTFNLTENETYVFNFSANHSVGNNLTYEIWMDSVGSCEQGNSSSCNYSEIVSRNSLSRWGNSTNFTWSFVPNFTDETYGLLKNMTVRVYPSDFNLESAALLNSSLDIKLNISNKNHPLQLTGISIGDQQANNDQTIVLDLSNYFLDYDALDSFYNQKVNFSVQSGESPTLISSSFNGWLLTLQLSSSVFGKISRTETLNITAYEINSTNFTIRNVTSNSFVVRFVEPTIVGVNRPSFGGGSTTVTKHTSLLISVPSAIQAGFGDRIEVPISIKNNGEVAVSGISLSGLVKLGEENIGDVSITLSKTSIPSLAIGAKEDLVASLSIDTKKAGRYTGVIYAKVTSPKFNQEGQFYIEVEVIPGKNVEEVLVFTEKLIADNPECIELRARLEEVRKLKEEGRFEEANALSQEVVDACRKSISQKKKFSLLQGDVSKSLVYLFTGLLGVFLFILVFYVYKRVKFNKDVRDEYI